MGETYAGSVGLVKRGAFPVAQFALVPVLVVASLLVGACSTDPGSGTAGRARSPLPDLQVDNLTSGGKVQLSSYLPAAKPVLVWFWAPY